MLEPRLDKSPLANIRRNITGYYNAFADEVGTVDSFSVLLVDDEKDFLETLVKRMKKRITDVEGVASGEEALEFLKDHRIDVVVLDVKMPGMDGIDSLREIKKRHPLIEVILLTGHASMEVAIQGMELGAFDYLMKPMNIDELLYKLQDAHKKKSLHEKKIRKMQENSRLSQGAGPIR
jgi:DNA-binding NtrC family response regulator